MLWHQLAQILTNLHQLVRTSWCGNCMNEHFCGKMQRHFCFIRQYATKISLDHLISKQEVDNGGEADICNACCIASSGWPRHQDRCDGCYLALLACTSLGVLTCWLCSVFYPLRTQIDFDLVDRTIPVQGALSALTLSQPCQHTTALFAPCQHKTYTVVRKNQHIRNQHVPKHHNNSSSWCLGISVVFIHIVCQPNLFSNCSIPLNLDGRCVSQSALNQHRYKYLEIHSLFVPACMLTRTRAINKLTGHDFFDFSFDSMLHAEFEQLNTITSQYTQTLHSIATPVAHGA